MYVSIDVGKTNTRVSSSRDSKNIFKKEKFLTSQSLEEEKKLIKDAVYKVTDLEQIQAISVGLPGIIDRISNTFYKVNTYPELNGLPFQAFLQGFAEKIPKIIVENDALLAAFGEAVGGSGKEFDIVAYLTLSTGVGGARISFKEIDQSYYFSEPGHQIIVQDGREDPFCGQKGCLQSYVSGPAFEEIYKMKPEECKDGNIWSDYSKHLASGLINIISMWTPEVIVLGGGISQKFDYIYSDLMDNLRKEKLFPIPEIRKSALGDDAGLLGGFIYISRFI